MAQGFYEILGVAGSASNEDINSAYHTRLAELVRRLRAARKQGADVTILEGQERALREAMQVLADPVRRQRYDAYQRACQEGMPTDAGGLWEVAKASLVDPVALPAVEVLRTTTELDVGNPFPDSPKPRRWVSRPPAPALAPAATPAVAATPAPPAPPAEAAPAPPLPATAAELEPTELLGEASDPEAEPTEQVEEPEPVYTLEDIPAIAERLGTDGRFLRIVRELRHMGLDDLATETRISLRYLEAIEGNDFDGLPAATFVRGYVKEVARALSITEVDAVEGYMGLFSQHRG